MTDPAGVPALQDAIRPLHGVESRHVDTVHVREVHAGQLVWEGDIEVFQLVKHPKAKKAFAWSEATTGARRREGADQIRPLPTSSHALVSVSASTRQRCYDGIAYA
jgi:hypothetical protein